MLRRPYPQRLRMTVNCRQGLSLLEVLISMFILLFGLVGVASLFPVGKYHATQALQYDRAAAVGQRAFEEIRVRGLLRPSRWNFENGNRFTDASGWNSQAVMFDPIAVANGKSWVTIGTSPTGKLPYVTWRVADIAGGNMPLATAEHIFRSTDDLNQEFPADRTTPVIQRITSSHRESEGNYTWAFTAAPARSMGEGYYNVCVVVFRGRNLDQEWTCTSTGVGASGVANGEVRLRVDVSKEQAARIKVGEWLMLSSPDYVPPANAPQEKRYTWYKILAIGINDRSATNSIMHLQVQGAFYPDDTFKNSLTLTFFTSAVAVFEQTMKVESDVDWKID